MFGVGTMNHFTKVFNYELPTEIIFGLNAVEQLPAIIENLNCKKILVVTDPGIKNA